MQHFFLSPELFSTERFLITNPEHIHQMQRVLRMRAGDKFIALDNTGFEYVCTIEKIEASEIAASILKKRKNTAEPVMQITLFQALPKKMELFEWVLQKGTEIGVSTFRPIITERTERDTVPKPERLFKILKEAAEQSERGKIPNLKKEQKFEDAVIEVCGVGNSSFLFDGRGDYPTFSNELREKHINHINLFIGPEGGFTEKEIDYAKQNNIIIVSLGKRVLRTETAGIVAAALSLA